MKSITNPSFRKTGVGSPTITVPCGKCLTCRKKRQRIMFHRLFEESKLYTSSLFVTLTFDDDHYFNHCDNYYGTISKRPLQLYFKRLRKSGLKFRYYAVAEYGPKTGRAHYHVILFGLSLSDSSLVTSKWTFGYSQVSLVNGSRLNYCCSYLGKPLKGEWHILSRRPMIGYSYVANTVSYYRSDTGRNYAVLPGSVKVPLHRGFRLHFASDFGIKILPRPVDVVESTEDQKRRHRHNSSIVLRNHKNRII